MQNDPKKSMCFKTWYDLTIDLPEKYFYWCCKTIRTKEQIDPTRFDVDNISLDYIINNPIIKNRKKELLTGVRSIECADCWNNEDASGSSFRTAYYGNANLHKLSPVDLRNIENQDLTRKIELVLTNKCNSACVYCWEGLSSRWQKETKKFFDDTDDIIFEKVIEILKEYWETELHKKSYISFSLLGGEPFFTDHMFYFIDNFINKLDIQNQRIDVEVTTNLNFTKKVFDKFINAISKNTNVNYNLIASGEAIEDKFEYIRWGSKWNTWDSNFDIINHYAEQLPNLTVSLGSAHNYLSLPYLKDFLSYIETKNIKKPVALVANWVEFPYPLSIRMLNHEHIHNIDECIEYLNSMKTKLIRKDAYIAALKTMKNMINTDVTNDDVKASRTFFKNLEQRRNISFSDVFPHFDDNFKTDK